MSGLYCVKCNKPVREFVKHTWRCWDCVREKQRRKRLRDSLYSKRYAKTHPEAHRAQNREYARTHREAMALYKKLHPEIRKRYYEKHREVILLRGKQYRKTHREAIALRRKQYYESHPEALEARRLLSRRWYEANRKKQGKTIALQKAKHLSPKEYAREYYWTHREARLLYAKQYHEINFARKLQYRHVNREHSRLYKKQYKMREIKSLEEDAQAWAEAHPQAMAESPL